MGHGDTHRKLHELFNTKDFDGFDDHLAAGEDGPDGAPVVVVSHDYWERELGADPRAVGKHMEIDDAPHTIIGVLPPEFHFAAVGDAQLWFPLDGSAQRRLERFNHWVNVVARLRPEVTVELTLGLGSVSATVWTCDLSYDYVRINAEYHT